MQSYLFAGFLLLITAAMAEENVIHQRQADMCSNSQYIQAVACQTGFEEESVRISIKHQCRQQNGEPLLERSRLYGCAVNASGSYCFWIARTNQNVLRDVAILQDNNNVCSFTGSCISECRSVLQRLSNELGCCYNAFSDILDEYPYSQFTTIYNDTLLSLCDVETETETCEGIFDLTIPEPSTNCTDQSETLQSIDASCMNPALLTYYYSLDCTRLSGDIRRDFPLCGFRNGQYCFESSDNFNQDVDEARMICNRDTDLCSTDCMRRLSGIKEDYGCCARGLGIANSDLPWSPCGIDPPNEYCDVRLTSSSVTSMKMASSSAVITAILTLAIATLTKLQ